ncbi:MAG: ATP-dependent DNA helicase RecG [Candidatus Gracilibacteria bacterium]|nr:ATP-dependent DNA helicase RecG [Candidatus Gracilibacteria bacterium]
MEITLQTDIQEFARVGMKYASLLRALGINTLYDLLTYFPRDYDDQTELRKINEMRTGEKNVVRGQIWSVKSSRTKYGKQITRGKLSDDTGSIEVVWWNQPYIARAFRDGEEVIMSGKLKYAFGRMTLQSPAYEKVKKDQTHTARIVPIYAETAGLTSKWLRFKLKDCLEYVELIPEFLPEEILDKNDLISIGEAIRQIHFPDSREALAAARKRLGFNELFIIQLNALRQKILWRANYQGFEKQIPLDADLIKEFSAKLPFQLTNAQKKAAYEILKDLEKSVPMLRLLEGDVGSGKTIVATIALLNTIKAGYQTALMVPTEVLAKQHFAGLAKLLAAFGVNTQFLAGSTTAKENDEIRMGLQNGLIDLVIGTHAIIQEGVNFKNLGLAIVDEQHRFGVLQRAKLKAQGSPHLLNMTATPIPRSLALTLYGDQDLSIIDEMPPGRKKIITKVVMPTERQTANLFIEDQVAKGRQIFVICPLIEDSDVLEVKSATAEYERLQKEVFPKLKVGLLHGKMKQKEKDAIMQDFKDNNINILVSTSVIEVGIDIPNATIMLIEGADRFGLAQLHQFRGRVGRGEYQSYCLLFSDADSENAKIRLKAMEQYDDGFKLAEIDLEMRGPGEVFGTRQSGIPDLKMASLSDHELIKQSRDAAEQILEQDPELEKHELILQEIEKYQKERELLA